MSDQTCANCGESNPERAAFCMNCGSPLAVRCSNCGTENPPGARFCMKCGNALGSASTDQPGPKADTGRAHDAGPAQHPEERRNASVLFADLAGYTAVAEKMDPEAVKSMIDRCLQRLAAEVDRFGGHVDKFIGDNIMAVFGAPIAHEDDPERAVRAGLGMQSAMEEINAAIADTADVSFSLRVGINSGEVLAGQVGEGYTVIGDTVNVAARLQAAAEPGSDGRRADLAGHSGADRLSRAQTARAEGQEQRRLRLAGDVRLGGRRRAGGSEAEYPSFRSRRRVGPPPLSL